MRNTPIQTRRARQGFQPLPNTQTTDHPQDQITPNKTHTFTSGGVRSGFPGIAPWKVGQVIRARQPWR